MGIHMSEEGTTNTDKTPKYMQKQAEIDVNRDIFAYICTTVAVNRDIYRDMGLYWSRKIGSATRKAELRTPKFIYSIDSRL
jgi:uncharacterized protein affecting Mg2+/Co2+ transport